MRSKDYRSFLEDIRKSCKRVMRYTAGITREQFLTNELIYDATIRHLTIIGEAVKQIPQEIREEYPTAEWKEIGRFRDHVIHRYFSVDDKIIWEVVTSKVPELLAALSAKDESMPEPL